MLSISEAILVAANALVAGENRLSVEVHQSSLNGSDIAFGMQLLIESVPEPTDADLAFNEISPAGDANFPRRVGESRCRFEIA